MIALFVLAACGSDPIVQEGNAEHIATNLDDYPAFRAETGSLPIGLHGIVKLTAEHGFVDADGEMASFTAQGAGTLWVTGEHWYVVTARHVVIPNTTTQSVGDVELGRLEQVWTRVAMSSLGIVPASILVSETEDVALLAVDPADRASLEEILNFDAASPISAAVNADAAAPGVTVEAWGFPSKHHPQVRKPAISARNEDYLVLNEELQRGFSGGPVFVEVSGRKRIAGIITRADEQAEQTTVLGWSTVSELQGAGGVTLTVPGEVQYKGVALRAPPQRQAQ